MARGYQRRQAEQQHWQADQWRRTRWLGTILLNVNRDPKTPAIQPEEVFWLLGDAPPEVVVAKTPQEVEAEFARTQTLDKDLF